MNYMFRLIFLISFCFISVLALSQDSDKVQEIIDKTIEAHGGSAYDDLAVSFTFRKKDYTIKLDKGAYEYTRSFSDSTGQILDILSNDGFERKLNGYLVSLSEKDKKRYANALNSVCYFAMLPNGLNDPAVKKSMIGLNKIGGQKYHVVQVSFEEEGGGDDHEDVYIYWINQKTYTVDFFAYSYEVNGGGVRFRAVKDHVNVDGVRFQNYINYKHLDKDVPVDSLAFYYVQGELKKLSEIINEDVKMLK